MTFQFSLKTINNPRARHGTKLPLQEEELTKLLLIPLVNIMRDKKRDDIGGSFLPGACGNPLPQ